MRLVPDGPDRSPWTIFLVTLEILVCASAYRYAESFGIFHGVYRLAAVPLLMVAGWDVIKARRYRKYPWERPLTPWSTIAEWRRMKRMSKGASQSVKSVHLQTRPIA